MNYGVIKLREYIVLNEKNKDFCCGQVINYSNLNKDFFENYCSMWKRVGIENGNKIGICFESNQLIMPLILSFDHIICNLEFLSHYMMEGLILKNFSRYNYIITDKELNFTESYCKRFETSFLGVSIFVYHFMVDSPSINNKSYVYYTSGSTGVPKAFYKTEDAIVKEGEKIINALNIKNTDRMLCVAPCCHTLAQSVACIAAALAGATVEYMSCVVSPNSIIKRLKNNNYELLITTPLYYEYLVGDIQTLNNIRELITGGARLSDKVLSSGVKIKSFYGSTETGVVAINDGNVKDKAYVGKIVDGVKILWKKEIDIDNEHVLKNMEVKSEFNAYKCMIGEKVYNYAEGVIPLNDYGYKDEHEQLFVYGRTDNIVNIHGMKVSCQEIEDTLSVHMNVSKVKAVKKVKNNNEYIIAYVILKRQEDNSIKNLFNFCKINMEHYKIPKEIILVDSFEYTNTGKITVSSVD